jgi:ribosomal protein S18 acetylase RimI-like enzyme
MNSVEVRPYRPADRAAVRRICCDTADCGRPVDRFFPDRELFADLITRYYTDYEPQSTWVAVSDGRVVGYISGSLDSARSRQITAWRIAPRAVLGALVRGTLWHQQMLRLVRANLSLWFSGGSRRDVSLKLYPAHLHVNLATEFRGEQLGRQLVEVFCAYARAAGLRGVHAGVREDNGRGRNFFEQLGFTVVGRYPLMRWPEPPHQLLSSVIYGKRL